MPKARHGPSLSGGSGSDQVSRVLSPIRPKSLTPRGDGKSTSVRKTRRIPKSERHRRSLVKTVWPERLREPQADPGTSPHSWAGMPVPRVVVARNSIGRSSHASEIDQAIAAVQEQSTMADRLLTSSWHAH